MYGVRYLLSVATRKSGTLHGAAYLISSLVTDSVWWHQLEAREGSAVRGLWRWRGALGLTLLVEGAVAISVWWHAGWDNNMPCSALGMPIAPLRWVV